jgi:hypothetical protein
MRLVLVVEPMHQMDNSVGAVSVKRKIKMAKHLYLVKYPWGGDIPLDHLQYIINNIVDGIENADPDNYVVVLPDEITLEQFDLDQLKQIYTNLGSYIRDVEERLEEEEDE